MTMHDWSRVDDDAFHHFHGAWIFALARALNAGRLPPGYYAFGEQHLSRKSGDVLGLHASDPDSAPPPAHPGDRAVALAEALPRVSRTVPLKVAPVGKQRTLSVRHSRGHRIVALVEVVSTSNKATGTGRAEFVEKVTAALRGGIHCAVLDVLPRGRHDPSGMHGLIVDELGGEDEAVPPHKQFTFSSYLATDEPVAYLQHFALGEPVPNVPLFLTPQHYIDLPAAESYAEAYRDMPEFFREILGRPA
jgi:hypothetical protein